MDTILIVCLVVVVLFGGIALAINISLKAKERKAKKAQEEQKRKQYDEMIKEIDSSTWRFPIDIFKKECNKAGIFPPLNETSISKTKKVIQRILLDLEIPEKYHSKYTTEENINFYFEETTKNDLKTIVQWINKEASVHKIETISNEAEYQKAKLVMMDILKKAKINPRYHEMYLDRAKIEECFLAAAEKQQEKKDKKHQRQLDRTREKELQLEKEYSEDLKHTGKEKTVHFIKKQIALFESKIEDCKNEYDRNLHNASKKSLEYDKKSNTWAYQGGIASAIAGPVAGLMIASDAKKRDDERNQQNAELSAMNLQLFILEAQRIESKQAGFEAELRLWKDALKSTKYQLEECKDAEYLLDFISPKVTYYYSSDTGAVRLKIGFSETSDLKICDDKRGYVDGSIFVDFLENGEVCASTICCLPYGGTSKECEAKCICTQTKPLDKNKKYSIHFRPNKLWAMEYTAEIGKSLKRLEKYNETNGEIQ